MTRADRSSRAGVVTMSLAAAAVALGGYLVWGLRSLIVPMAVGGLLAYIVRPLVARLERLRVPRGLAIGLLLLVFGLAALFIVTRIRAVMPSDIALLEHHLTSEAASEPGVVRCIRSTSATRP